MQCFAEGDLHVTKRSARIVGLSILFLFGCSSGALVYFKLRSMIFVFSVLAFFSLTASYLIPAIYKIKRSQETIHIQASNSAGAGGASRQFQSVKTDLGLDVDFKGKQNEQSKNQLLADYFEEHGVKQEEKVYQPPQIKKGITKLCQLIFNLILIAIFLSFYALIGYNFAFNIVKVNN